MADYGQYPDSIGEINKGFLKAKRAGLTPQMRVLLSYVQAFSADHNGIMPSYDEMREALGLRSKSGVHRLVSSLQSRGYLVKDHRARSIRLVAEPGTTDAETLLAAIKTILAMGDLSGEVRRELFGMQRIAEQSVAGAWRSIGAVSYGLIGGAK